MIQAKRCFYNGRWYKSNVEGKTAEALDKLGIPFEYEHDVFRGAQYSWNQYTPDFWLPETDQYIEVTGQFDHRHFSNAQAFDNSTGHKLIGVSGNGALCFPGSMETSGNCVVFKCTECGKSWIMDESGVWECPYCHSYDGDHYIASMYFNLFDAASVKRYEGR